jgi:hypothetical protein
MGILALGNGTLPSVGGQRQRHLYAEFERVPILNGSISSFDLEYTKKSMPPSIF